MMIDWVSVALASPAIIYFLVQGFLVMFGERFFMWKTDREAKRSRIKDQKNQLRAMIVIIEQERRTSQCRS